MRRIAILLRTFVALFLFGALAVPSFAAGVKNLTPAEAKTLLAKDKRIFLLDVRTPEEYRQARLQGSRLIPLSELQARLAEVPRNRPVLVYCAVGSRSAAAGGILASRGYHDVLNMTNGIVGWYRSGFPIER